MSIGFDYSGRQIVITGAGQGLGFEMAREFLAAGAAVHIWDYAPTALDHAGKELAQFKDRLTLTQVDITQAEACSNAAANIDGPVHVIVNNAGITRDRSFAKLSIESIDQVINTNLLGAFYVTKALLPHLDLSQPGNRIINIASIVGRDGNFGQSNYAAAKAGLIGLTKTLAKELGPKGVTVNCIAPGFIETAMAQASPAEARSRVETMTPVGRFGQPNEIAATCLFLASIEASYINGATIPVDGGLSL